jgi:hypothetical protein
MGKYISYKIIKNIYYVHLDAYTLFKKNVKKNINYIKNDMYGCITQNKILSLPPF